MQQLKTLSFSLRPAQLDLLGLVAGDAIGGAAHRRAGRPGIQRQLRAARSRRRWGRTASVAAAAGAGGAEQRSAARAGLAHRACGCASCRRAASACWWWTTAWASTSSQCSNGQPSEHNVGLYGMIERTELAGGTLHIRTRPGRGVAIRAVL